MTIASVIISAVVNGIIYGIVAMIFLWLLDEMDLL